MSEREVVTSDRIEVSSARDMTALAVRWGFLPFFAGEVAGFSLEECVSPECWFPDGTVEGVWEWKSDVIIEGDCAYGKLYRGKAMFVSMAWYPDLLNYRSASYCPTEAEAELLSTLRSHRSLLSRELKRLCGYVKARAPRERNPLLRMLRSREPSEEFGVAPRRQSFESALTRLQMACKVVSADFEYSYDRHGRRYGWSVARYCTPEDFFGVERLNTGRTPEQSYERLTSYLRRLLPAATPRQIARIVG